MSIDLLKTYDDMIRDDTTTQKRLDDVFNSVYIPYFVRPNLRINQRAGHKSNGEFVEGTHIYPDRESITEILTMLQDIINSNPNFINQCQNNELGTVLYILEIVNQCINKYFGSTENINERDNIFHFGDKDPNEYMANLSEFKGKNSAVCIERTLAAHVALCVIANNSELKNVFPYKPFMHFTICNLDIEKMGPAEGHALCGIISRNSNKVFLLDPTNYGKVEKRETGEQEYIYGVYELDEGETDSLFNGDVVVPELFRCKHLDGLTQKSHRAFSKKCKFNSYDVKNQNDNKLIGEVK